MSDGAMTSAVEVWWARPADARPSQVGLLEPVDLERHRALRRPADRLRFVTGAVLSRLAVARRLGRTAADLHVERRCEQCGRPHGRPRFTVDGTVAAPPFSISHAGDVVVVAVGDLHPVGVDVERLGSGTLPPARHITDDPECVDDDDLLRVWVGKEAALKATGEGLATLMTELALPGGVGRVQRRDRPGTDVHVSALRAPAGYVGALAVVGTGPRAVAHRDGRALLAGSGRGRRR